MPRTEVFSIDFTASDPTVSFDVTVFSDCQLLEGGTFNFGGNSGQIYVPTAQSGWVRILITTRAALGFTFTATYRGGDANAYLYNFNPNDFCGSWLNTHGKGNGYLVYPYPENYYQYLIQTNTPLQFPPPKNDMTQAQTFAMDDYNYYLNFYPNTSQTTKCLTLVKNFACATYFNIVKKGNGQAVSNCNPNACTQIQSACGTNDCLLASCLSAKTVVCNTGLVSQSASFVMLLLFVSHYFL